MFEKCKTLLKLNSNRFKNSLNTIHLKYCMTENGINAVFT